MFLTKHMKKFLKQIFFQFSDNSHESWIDFVQTSIFWADFGMFLTKRMKKFLTVDFFKFHMKVGWIWFKHWFFNLILACFWLSTWKNF